MSWKGDTMTRIFKFKCLVDGCCFFEKLLYAEKGQIKSHLKRDHDYTELLQTAKKLKIIKSVNNRRSPEWFAENLFKLSVLREKF